MVWLNGALLKLLCYLSQGWGEKQEFRKYWKAITIHDMLGRHSTFVRQPSFSGTIMVHLNEHTCEPTIATLVLLWFTHNNVLCVSKSINVNSNENLDTEFLHAIKCLHRSFKITMFYISYCAVLEPLRACCPLWVSPGPTKPALSTN